MDNENILTRKIHQALNEGRKALIPFVPAGFPSKDRFWDVVVELDAAGADIIEIGVPFSDPVADGPVVEKASLRALEQGVNLEWIIEGLAENSSKMQAGIVLMGYFNPFLQFGLQDLAQKAGKSGANGLIIPDLILEEVLPYIDLFNDHDLAYIPLVGLNTPPERLKDYAGLNPAFAYLVSVMGITGTRTGENKLLKDKLVQAREVFNCPIALGFGLSTKDQLERIRDLVDAVVFGSALISHLDEGKSAGDFLRSWR